MDGMNQDQYDVVENAIEQTEKEISPSRVALVKEWTERVRSAKKHHDKAFKRMREDMEAAYAGTSREEFKNGKKYVANIIQRHIAQRVSTLYAKNPKAIYQRRERRTFRVWDESLASLQAAYMDVQNSAATGMMPNPQSMQILQDYQTGMEERKMIDGVGDTLVKTFHYFLDEQIPSFKGQMKKLVRRAVTCAVGYVKIGFQRDIGRRPEVENKIADAAQQLAHIERLISEMKEGDTLEYEAQAEELRLMLQTLEQQPMLVLREGLVFDFPSATAIIIDPACKHLRGLVGARWVAHEILMSPEDVKEIYKVDLKKNEYTCYNSKGMALQSSGAAWLDTSKDKDNLVCVWEIYDKNTGMVYSVADGYRDFLEEPSAPNVTLERFFPIYPLVFNDIEAENELYPMSDVRMITPMQDEHNRSREGLREHRMAARPKYIAPKGLIEEQDKENLKTHPAHAVLEVNIAPGQKATDLIQPVPLVGVDPNLYITNHIMEDIQLVAGAQEAHFGGVAGATATETSVAEGARMSSLQSNIDDLDDFFTEIARDAGQILMLEMSPEQVTEIVGPGAVWPQMGREMVAKEIYLKIRAGSSGRPNKAADLANLERVSPFLLQIPGIDPEFLAKEYLRRLDDSIDLTEAIKAGVPSITAMNSQKQVGTGDASTDPNMQGNQGANNAPKARSSQGGSDAPMGANNMSGM